VSKINKTLSRVLSGTSDNNIGFHDLCSLLRHLGFDERIRGGHHIFTREGIPEILNIQPRDSQAKAYQVKQVRGVIVSHRLAPEIQEEDAPSGGVEPKLPADPTLTRPEEQNGA
jgi:hypothetical protein